MTEKLLTKELRKSFIVPVAVLTEKKLIQRLEKLNKKGIQVLACNGKAIDVLFPLNCHKKKYWEKEAREVYKELNNKEIRKS